MTKPKAERMVILTIRTPKELHRYLKAEARRNERSLNQEVTARLLRDRETAEAKPLLERLRSLLAERET